jgi:cytochrome c oxidase subunit II
MQILLILLAIVLVLVVILQVGKAIELISVMKSEDEYREEASESNGLWFVLSGAFLLVFVVATAYTSYDKFLPTPASEHGVWIESLINVTLFFTGTVFLATNFLLFYFTWKYRYKRNRKAYYFPDNNKLELAWTVIPAIVLTVLVAMGIDKWFKIFSDAPSDAIKLEATAKQFGWYIRYPGADDQLGPRDFTLANSENELGVNWNNTASQDDFLADEIVIPVNTPVLVNIAALDVIHNFYLPEFRLMMDAVPGVNTKFWFRPTITTAEMREIKGDPEFDYELACNQLCGSGHWNMKKTVRVVTEPEYRAWVAEQKSYYEQFVKSKEDATVPVAGASESVESDNLLSEKK